MRILDICDYLPYPLISGGRIRIYNLLARAAQQHEVSIASILKPGEEAYLPHLQSTFHRVETVLLKKRPFLAYVPLFLRYGLAGQPIENAVAHSEKLAHTIKQLAQEERFDIIQIESTMLSYYLDVLPKELPFKRILIFHNVAAEQYARIFRVSRTLKGKVRSWLYGTMMRRWESRYAEQFDRCIMMSEEDRRLLLKSNPRIKATVIPNGVDTRLFQLLPEYRKPPTLLFVGNMRYAPCADAMIYFCNEVLPHLRRTFGYVPMWIVGADPPDSVKQLSGNGVEVTGRVPEIIPYYRQSTISVVPLRAGGGTRLKILESMALGRPVISTTIGCEGLDIVDGEHLLIADTPQQFVAQTLRLLTDKALYRRLVERGRQLVVSHYDWDAISNQMMKVYADVMIS